MKLTGPAAEAQDYLLSLQLLDERIDSKLSECTRLRHLSERVAASFDAVYSSGRNTRSPVEDSVVKIVELEREIDADIDKLVDNKREAYRLLNQLDDHRERLVLELRYLRQQEWPKIMLQMHVAEAQIYRIHRSSLEHLYDIIQRNKAVDA